MNLMTKATDRLRKDRRAQLIVAGSTRVFIKAEIHCRRLAAKLSLAVARADHTLSFLTVPALVRATLSFA